MRRRPLLTFISRVLRIVPCHSLRLITKNQGPFIRPPLQRGAVLQCTPVTKMHLISMQILPGLRMPSKTRSSLRAREITVSDFDAVPELLGQASVTRRGIFCNSPSDDATARPEGFPKYGRLLECNGTIVGVIIFIFSRPRSGGITMIRCHVTGWCVEPAYRCYATMLAAKHLA